MVWRWVCCQLFLPVVIASAAGRWTIRGSGLTDGLLHALQLMRENPDWMSNVQACAKAVDGTLTTLEDTYLNPYVSFVLGTACEHHNVYQDFGGSEVSCKPVFHDLGSRFDGGKKDYAGWCSSTMSLLGGKSGSGGTKVANARSELEKLKGKHANGEDIHKDLDKLKAELDDADHAVDAARKLENEAHADDRSDQSGTAARVGESRWGGASTAEHNKKPPTGKQSSFGTEPVAQKLTKESRGESDAMVDQIEKAQVAEERRSAYRALTKLRHTTVSSYDAIAHGHMQNIHEHGEQNKWRDTHPINHLAEEEGDIEGWAFPSR